MSNPECGHWVPTKGCRVCGPENFGRPQPPPDGAGDRPIHAIYAAIGAINAGHYERAKDILKEWLAAPARSRPALPAAEPPLGSLAYKLGLLVETMDEEIAERERKKLRGSVAVLRAFRNQVAAIRDEAAPPAAEPNNLLQDAVNNYRREFCLNHDCPGVVVRKPAPAAEPGSLNAADVVAALKNIGYAVECGACMEVFYTGATMAEHTHPAPAGPGKEGG